MTTATFLVAGLLAMLALSSLSSVTALPTNAGAPMGNSSCLTPKQDDELRNAIAGIQITLSATVTALDLAAIAEKDPKTKHDLQEAAVVIQTVSKYLVANLTEIVDSACGNCSQIVRVVNESATVLEQTISHIIPELKNTTAWQFITTAINDILGIAEIICPDKAHALFHLRLRDSCLNATQLALFKKIIAGVQIVLTSAEVALDVAVAEETDATKKQQLEEADKVLKAISLELISNLTKIAESPCATCTEIVNMVEQLIHALEDTLQQINPDWSKDPLWQSIVQAINSIFGYVQVLCPSSKTVRFKAAAFVPQN